MHAARTPLPITGLAVACLAGVAACLALPVPPGPLAVVCAIALALVCRVRFGSLVLAFAFASFAWAALHAMYSLSRQVPAHPVHHDTTLVGRVATLPRQDPRRVVFEMDVEHDSGGHVAGRRVRISWYARGKAPVAQVRAGERWRMPVRLRAPRGLRNPGGSDAEMHAFADRLAAVGYVRAGPAAYRLAASAGLQGWREATSARIDVAVAAAPARFVRALALGDTRHLDDADWSVLRANGLTHLIAISGFHVGMVAGAAAAFVRVLWWLVPAFALRIPARTAAIMVGAAAAAAYAAAAGFSLPTVRTLLMIVVVMVATVSRRALRISEALACALIVVLLVDPLSALSAGFWLSFAGVAWLLWCMPRAGVSKARELVRAQAVASLGLLPLTVFLFGQASLMGPVANLVAVPVWSLLVAPLAVGGIALDAVHPMLGAASWTAAAWVFGTTWPVFEALASAPLSLVWLPESGLLAAAAALAAAFWWLLPRGTPGKPLAALLWLPMFWPDVGRPAVGEVEVTALDVGQGLAVLIRTHRHQLLYDAGPAVPDGFDAGERAVVPALHAKGVERLDALIVSHGDLDHAGGVESVRAAFPAHRVLAPDGSNIADSASCRGGMAWTMDGVRFRFLHPPPLFPYLANESSCVLRVETAHGSVLLTGDIGELIERRLLHEQPEMLRADVVFAAHHGSRHSSDPEFVAATRARHVVVSAGHGNRYRHPHDTVVRRWSSAGAQVWNTATSGALRIRVGAAGVNLGGRRDERPRLWDAARRIRAEDAGLSYRGD